jgi:hypothetical protein
MKPLCVLYIEKFLYFKNFDINQTGTIDSYT